MAALPQYPYLAQYKVGSQYAGMVVLVRAPRDSLVYYVPTSPITNPDGSTNPMYEVRVGDQHNVYSADVETFVGTVKTNNLTGVSLDIPQ